jgi:hypothetical protein
MKAQQQLSRIWNIVLQWFSYAILSPVVRRSMLCVAMIALALCLLSIAAFQQAALSHLHVLFVLHQLNKTPFTNPWP